MNIKIKEIAECWAKHLGRNLTTNCIIFISLVQVLQIDSDQNGWIYKKKRFVLFNDLNIISSLKPDQQINVNSLNSLHIFTWRNTSTESHSQKIKLVNGIQNFQYSITAFVKEITYMKLLFDGPVSYLLWRALFHLL